MNILEKIIAHKIKEVATAKAANPIENLEKSVFFTRRCLSISSWIKDKRKNGIIAEYKRKSPSKGFFNTNFSPQEVAQGYFAADCSAMSVLTDEHFFAGSSDDLLKVRETVAMPLLRKDFIIDEYQLLEAKAIGADCILLIAANLSPKDSYRLAAFARSLGLEVLLEVHDQKELDAHLNEHINMVGVNNRNLKTFEVSLQTSYDLVDKIPSHVVKISESGIDQPQTVVALRHAGFDGFLIGENFMKTENPMHACKTFSDTLKTLL